MAVDRYNPDDEIYEEVVSRLRESPEYPWDLIPEVADKYDVENSDVRKATRKLLVQEKRAMVIMAGEDTGQIKLTDDWED